jgi:hypothetical protein
MLLAGAAVQAAPLKLPPNAIADDTMFIATVDFVKADSATVDATAKAVLDDNLGPVGELLGQYKTHYEQYAGKGVESVTVVVRFNPDQRQEPDPVVYVKFKPGTDQAPVEKQIILDEGENNPVAMEISHDGDYMVLRMKGVELPAAGSEERTKLFTDAMGDSSKPLVIALSFNDAMVKSFQKEVGAAAAPGTATLVTESKWFRLEMDLGKAAKADVTIQTADADAGKRMADAVTAAGEAMKALVAQMRQAPAKGGQEFAEMIEGMSALAEEFKPNSPARK